MRSTFGDPAADEFLRRVRRESRRLPRAPQRELLDDITAHLNDAIAEAGGDETRLRTLIDALGSPAEIVAAAEPEPASSPALGGREITAILLLLLGGFLALVGWIVGVVLLWSSTAWNGRQKLIGTLVLPGGLAGVAILLGLGTVDESCTTETVNGRRLPEHCTGGTSFPHWAAIALTIVLVVAPIATSIYLATTAERRA